jgi:hypothetical protein
MRGIEFRRLYPALTGRMRFLGIFYPGLQPGLSHCGLSALALPLENRMLFEHTNGE